MALIFFVLPSAAQAAAPAEISVSGQGTVTLAPDEATVDASIANNDASADRAVSQNNATYAAVVARLAQAGVKKERIQTTFFNVSFVPPPEEVSPGPGNVLRPRPPSERYGYIANRGLSITVSDVKAAGRVIDALVTNPNVTVGNVAFGIRDRRNAYRAALTRAVNDAQTQAQTLALAAHLRVIRLKSMQEGYASAPPVPMIRTMAAASAVAPPTEISPGSVNVSATVTLVYEASP